MLKLCLVSWPVFSYSNSWTPVPHCAIYRFTGKQDLQQNPQDTEQTHVWHLKFRDFLRVFVLVFGLFWRQRRGLLVLHSSGALYRSADDSVVSAEALALSPGSLQETLLVNYRTELGGGVMGMSDVVIRFPSSCGCTRHVLFARIMPGWVC